MKEIEYLCWFTERCSACGLLSLRLQAQILICLILGFETKTCSNCSCSSSSALQRLMISISKLVYVMMITWWNIKMNLLIFGCCNPCFSQLSNLGEKKHIWNYFWWNIHSACLNYLVDDMIVEMLD
jgi:hypothetical protein